MTRDRDSPSRRSVLRIAGLSIGTLSGVSGSAAASGRSNRDRQLWVEDGRFHLDLDRDEIGDDLYEKWNEVIRDFNREIRAGNMRLRERASTGHRRRSAGRGESTVLEVNGNPAAIERGDR